MTTSTEDPATLVAQAIEICQEEITVRLHLKAGQLAGTEGLDDSEDAQAILDSCDREIAVFEAQLRDLQLKSDLNVAREVVAYRKERDAKIALLVRSVGVDEYGFPLKKPTLN